jgi:hypothetical protein
VGDDLPGSAGLQLAGNVVHLDAEPAVFEAMLGGGGGSSLHGC